MTRILRLILYSHHDLFDHQNTHFSYPLCIFRFIDSKETANLSFHVNKQAHYDPGWIYNKTKWGQKSSDSSFLKAGFLYLSRHYMKKVLPLYNSVKRTPFLHIKFIWKQTIMIANQGIVVKYFEMYRPNDY